MRLFCPQLAGQRLTVQKIVDLGLAALVQFLARVENLARGELVIRSLFWSILFWGQWRDRAGIERIESVSIANISIANISS